MIIEAINGDFGRTVDLFVVPVILFGPPIALLVFGAATRWAFRGFHADDRPSNAGDTV